jgi:hypothetical protein
MPRTAAGLGPSAREDTRFPIASMAAPVILSRAALMPALR